MKTSSFARHITTFLAGLGTQLLALHWINADAVPGINESATALTDPLIVVIGLVGALLTRVVIGIVCNLFRLGAGEDSKGSAGGLSPCVLGLCMAAGLMGLILPSCTPAQIEAARAVPITASLSYRDPNSGAKAGLSYSPTRKLRGKLRVPFYDPQTGELLGSTGIALGKKPVVTATK